MLLRVADAHHIKNHRMMLYVSMSSSDEEFARPLFFLGVRWGGMGVDEEVP